MKLNTEGVDEYYAEIFEKCLEILTRKSHLQIVNDDVALYNKIEEACLAANIFSHSFNFKNIAKVEAAKGVYFLVFTEIDFGYTYSPKYGQSDRGLEYQLWAYYPLNDDYGNILLKTKEPDDKIKTLLERIFQKRNAFKIENETFNKHYVVVGDVNNCNRFFNRDIVKAISNIPDLNFVVNNNQLIAGFRRSITPAQTVHLDHFLKAI